MHFYLNPLKDTVFVYERNSCKKYGLCTILPCRYAEVNNVALCVRTLLLVKKGTFIKKVVLNGKLHAACCTALKIEDRINEKKNFADPSFIIGR